MSVIPLTLAISLCLVFTFIIFFLRENSRRRFSSVERESLLPLAEEIPHVVGHVRPTHRHEHEHGHEPAEHDNCGCRTGKRAPCVGCLKQRPAPPA